MPSPSDPGKDFDAAIVIVNYRTAELVEECLESVRASGSGLRLQTVVVDNASRDGSVERLRAHRPQVTVIGREENGGFAAGVNTGFRHTTAPVVIVLNPDTQLGAGTIPALLERLRAHPGTGVAAPLLEHADGRLAPNGYRRFPGLFTLMLDTCIPLNYLLVHAPRLHPYAMAPAALLAGERPAWVCGAALAIRRSAYKQAGALDEGFFLYFEETEWQQRLRALHWEIELVPSARARHLLRGGGEEALVHSPHFLRSAVRYLGMRGVPAALARALLAISLAASWAMFGAIACIPAKRARARGQARAYRALLRQALSGAPT